MRSDSLNCWSSSSGSSQWNGVLAFFVVCGAFIGIPEWVWRSGLRRCSDSAAVKNQGRLGLGVAALDFTDEDDMVALRVAAAVVAFEPVGDAFDDRQAGMRQFEFNAVETVFDAL